MKKVQSRFCFLFVTLLLFSGSMRLHGQASDALGPFRTQTIELQEGWNAVYLEIEPKQTDPNVLFEGTPIEIAAAYLRPVTAQQFVDSPNDLFTDRKGWGVWYQSDRADALLTDLYAIQAHGSYLVYSESAYTWQLEGTPFYGTALWHPNAYSLVGFPINTSDAPTVENFFAGVDAHASLKVYRMLDGRWTLITAPESTLMETGVAYWTHSSGASSFSGPLRVDFQAKALGGMIFTMNGAEQSLVLSNTSPYPQMLTLSLNGGETGVIPLTYEVITINGLDQEVDSSSVALESGMSVGPLEPGMSLILDLGVAGDLVTQTLMTTTLVVSSDAGVRLGIPIVSARADLDTND